MLRTPTSLCLISVASYALPAVSASSPYCEILRKQTASENALLKSPNIYGRTEVIRPNEDSNKPADYDPYAGRQYEYGLEWGAHRLWQGMLRSELTELECDRQTYLDQLKTVNGFELDYTKQARLEAELQILVEALPVYSADFETAKQRFDRNVIGIQEYDNIASTFHKLQSEIHSRELALSQVKLLTGTDNSQDPVMSPEQIIGKLQETENRRLQVQQSILNARSWEFNVLAGRKEYEYKDLSKGALFAALEVKFNLGNVTRIGDQSDVTETYHRAMASQPAVMALQNSIMSNEILTKRREILTASIKGLEERESMLRPFGLKYEAQRSSVMRELHWRWTFARVELASNKEELRLLNGAKKTPEIKKDKEEVKIPVPEKELRPGLMKSNVANFRWTTHSDRAEQAEIEFRVSGKSQITTNLGSGEVRRQLGIMIREENQCNLVYAMWRLEENQVVVQEKVNPGKTTHDQCENHGYSRIKPTTSKKLGSLEYNTWHKMKALIEANKMSVFIDDNLVWEGSSPKKIVTGNNIGFRSDNLDVEYRVVPAAGGI